MACDYNVNLVLKVWLYASLHPISFDFYITQKSIILFSINVMNEHAWTWQL